MVQTIVSFIDLLIVSSFVVMHMLIQVDDSGDDLQLPNMSVPEVETIPLPPPFVTFDPSWPFEARACLLLRRTQLLVHKNAHSETASEDSDIDNNSGTDYEGDDMADEKDDIAAMPLKGVGLLEENGYLLDAFLPSSEGEGTSIHLQAFFLAEPTEEKEDHNEEAREKSTKEEPIRPPLTKFTFFVWDNYMSNNRGTFQTMEEAIQEFKARFFNFTGHAWDDRANFRHHPTTEQPVSEEKRDEQAKLNTNKMEVVDTPKAHNQDEGQKEKEEEARKPSHKSFFYLPTNHEALRQQQRLIREFKDSEEDEDEDEMEESIQESESDEEISDGDEESIQRFDGKCFGFMSPCDAKACHPSAARRKKKTEKTDDIRLHEMLAFISNKRRLWHFCKRYCSFLLQQDKHSMTVVMFISVGLFRMSSIGQLTSAQIKIAYQILDVISGTYLPPAARLFRALLMIGAPRWCWHTGIIAYKKELKKRKRPIPAPVDLALRDLSNKFHCVLPFNFSQCNLSLHITKRRTLSEKLTLLQVV